MLHTPVYDVGARAFCGPTAISSVANVPISRVHKMARRARKEWGGSVRDCNNRLMPVRGMYNSELLTIMKRLGFKSKPHREYGMTLGEFLQDRGHMGPFIVNVTGHYVAVSHGMICDTYTKTPVPLGEYPRMKKIVKRFWLFK